MKKNKGFTLIELLAIIVILAIIAVITVPIILNIIENAKMGTIQDSAYGYKDAINKYYLTKLAEDSDFEIADGTYTKDQLKTMGVAISGEEPHSNTWIGISNNVVVSGCIQFGEYKVEIINGKIGPVEKGTCGAAGDISKIKMYASKNSTTEISINDVQVGSYITIGDDENKQGFYAISAPTNGKLLILAEYNIIPSAEWYATMSTPIEWKQGDASETGYEYSYKVIEFTPTVYWYNCMATTSTTSEQGQCSKIYENLYDDEEYAYIYDQNSNLYQPMEIYRDYLEETVGNGIITDVRPMSFKEANSIISNSWVYNQTYFLGSSSPIGDGMWHIDSREYPEGTNYRCPSYGDGSCFYYDEHITYTNCSDSGYGVMECYDKYGVRPVIEISTQLFN